jgi:tetratricopeptide (TPR) repeat protein
MPPADLRYMSGMAFYARGMAFSAMRRWAEARAALDTVKSIGRIAPEGDNRTALVIAALALEADVLARSGKARTAVPLLQKAVDLEDGLAYTEPPTWYYPMRQSLGKAQLMAGDAASAEQTYREDLRRFPRNGWSLLGLQLSLERQGRLAEAKAAAQELADAWKEADVRLSGSRF